VDVPLCRRRSVRMVQGSPSLTPTEPKARRAFVRLLVEPGVTP
jgi:hypothetical protein